MTASLRSTGRQKYILQYVSWFTDSSPFFIVNHKFEGGSVGEDSLRQMFVKSHASIHSTSGSYVKWVWGVRGPQRSSPLSLIKSHVRKVFITLPAPPLPRGLSSPLILCFLSDVKHLIFICHMWGINCSLNVVLIGCMALLQLNFTFLKMYFSRP